MKIWLDSLKKAPNDYEWAYSVDELKKIIDKKGVDDIEEINMSVTAGDMTFKGGDWDVALDYLASKGATDLHFCFHEKKYEGKQPLIRKIVEYGWDIG